MISNTNVMSPIFISHRAYSISRFDHSQKTRRDWRIFFHVLIFQRIIDIFFIYSMPTSVNCSFYFFSRRSVDLIEIIIFFLRSYLKADAVVFFSFVFKFIDLFFQTMKLFLFDVNVEIGSILLRKLLSFMVSLFWKINSIFLFDGEVILCFLLFFQPVRLSMFCVLFCYFDSWWVCWVYIILFCFSFFLCFSLYDFLFGF